MTTKVFGAAQEQLDLERRRTREARHREERALVAAEVARLEAEMHVNEAVSLKETSEARKLVNRRKSGGKRSW